MSVQVEVPAGSVFAWEGRIWHGLGVNTNGAPRRSITTFFCLPWMRQQENWGVSCLQEVLDEASPKVRARLGLRTYGTLGGVNGNPQPDAAPGGLGNADVEFPDYIIGEGASLHPLRNASDASKRVEVLYGREAWGEASCPQPAKNTPGTTSMAKRLEVALAGARLSWRMTTETRRGKA